MTKSNKKEKNCIVTLSKSGTTEIPAIKDFKARRIHKSELAGLYDLTVDGLRKKMLKKRLLIEELESIGYETRQKEFTKQQVQLIIKHLGEPYQ